MTILNEKFLMVIYILLYKFILEVSYILFVEPAFGYMGFTFTPNAMKFLESYLCAIFLLFFLPLNERKPSTILLNILYLIMIIPIFSLYSLMDEARIYFYAVFISYLTTLILVNTIPTVILKGINRSKTLLFWMLGGISIFVYFVLLYYNGLPSLKALNLLNVYDIRSEVNYGFNIMSYLTRWQAQIINLFFIWFGWQTKNKKIFILGLVLQLLIFLITGHKTYLFFPILLLFLMYFIYKKQLVKLCLFGLIGITSGSLFIYLMNLSVLPASLFIRRSLFVPAQLSFQYYDFFSQNSFAYLSHSIFEAFWGEPIYSEAIPRLIGFVYSGREVWANTGYLGDAYLNFGISGMVIFSIAFSVILKLIDSLSNTSHKKVFSGAILGTVSINFVNGALLTTLLTGGVLFYILILWLYQDS